MTQEDRMNIAKWFERIYTEKNIGRGVATSVAGIAGLIIWYFSKDWIATVLVLVAVYSTAQIVADPIHHRLTLARQRRDRKKHMEELFDQLGWEEHAVVQEFVRHGSSVVTWGVFNKSQNFSLPGIESLINRGLAQQSLTADGITETFVLDADLFGYAQTVLPQAKSTEL